RQAVRADSPVPRRGPVLDLAAPARREHLPRRREPPQRSPLGAARRRAPGRARERSRPRGRALGAAGRALLIARRDRARPGAGRRPEGRARLLLRRDLGRLGHARRDGEVLRAPRTRAAASPVAGRSEEQNRGKLALVAGIDDVRFKRIVRPGDELTLTCDLEAVRGPIGRGKARATVDGDLAVRGTLTFAVDAS